MRGRENRAEIENKLCGDAYLAEGSVCYQSYYYLAPLPDSDCCFSPACSSCVHFSHNVT